MQKLTWFKEFFGVSYSAARNMKTWKDTVDKNSKSALNVINISIKE